MTVEEFTSLRVRKSTRDRLRLFGSKHEPLDEVLVRVLVVAEKGLKGE